jgi:preprotein translocase subunit YajC
MRDLNVILLPLLLLAIFWLMVFRPQRRAIQARAQLQRSLQPGDEVLTAGGLIATIRRLDGDTVTVELAPGVEVKIDRRYVTGKKNPAVGDTGGAESDTAEPDGHRDQR